MLTGELNENSLKILSDNEPKIWFSGQIFVLIDSENIDPNKFQFNLANLVILQSQETNLNLCNLNSFSLINFLNAQKKYTIQIDTENESLRSQLPILYAAMIGQHESVDLKFENNTSNIDLLLNFSEATQFSMNVNSLIQTNVEMSIINANSIQISNLNNT